MKILLLALATIAFSPCKEEEKEIIISNDRTPEQQAESKAEKERLSKVRENMESKYGKGIEKPKVQTDQNQ